MSRWLRRLGKKCAGGACLLVHFLTARVYRREKVKDLSGQLKEQNYQKQQRVRNNWRPKRKKEFNPITLEYNFMPLNIDDMRSQLD